MSYGINNMASECTAIHVSSMMMYKVICLVGQTAKVSINIFDISPISKIIAVGFHHIHRYMYI